MSRFDSLPSYSDSGTSGNLEEKDQTFTKSQSIVMISLLNASILGILTFIILICSKLDQRISEEVLWTHIMIAPVISLALICFAALYWISLVQEHINNLGKIFLQCCTVTITLLSICFMFILSLKIDSKISITYIQAFIPLFILLGFVFYGLIFLLPGLIQVENPLYKEATLMFMYYVLITSSIIMACLKCEKKFPWKWDLILGIPGLGFVIDFALTIGESVQNEFSEYMGKLFILIMIIISFVLISLKIDETIDISWLAELGPLILMFIAIQYKMNQYFLKFILYKDEKYML